MMTPYDWQEGIGHRAQYVESRLASGTPVLVASTPDGVLAATYRRQARKVFEVYDRLLFSALGQQSDVEAMRVAAIEFTHREGFQRSEQDVTVQRVVAGLSEPVKRAFADFNGTPYVVRAVFAELGETPELDRFFVMDYDGDYMQHKGHAALAGTNEAAEVMARELGGVDFGALKLDAALEAAQRVLSRGMDPEGAKGPDERLEGLTLEAGLLERAHLGPRRFRLIAGSED